MKNGTRAIGDRDYYLYLIFFLAVLLFLSMAYGERMKLKAPVFKGYHIMVVLSGSMRPVFDTGAVIGAKKVDPKEIKVGNIITFRDLGNPHRLITHRVVDIEEQEGKKMFSTKGDANESKDFWSIPETNLIGRVDFSIPYAGYLVNFLWSKRGMALLLLAPVLAILFTELWSGKNRLKKNIVIKVN